MEADQVVVGPTEDTVLALLEVLVDPLLPSRTTAMESPSPSQEETMAKQMHAVVLLYNYYHRKWEPKLEFLEFDSFCKLCVIFKPSLLSYMKLMRTANYDALHDPDKQLSLTEKLIMDACNISRSLDASKDVPITEGQPVTKLGIFLVDSEKENCFLLHSSITRGVWSLIEKELDAPNQSSEHSSFSATGKKRIIKKLPKVNQISDKAALEELALAAAVSMCGLTQGDIRIFESHITYSLSKENAATRLYVMQCMQPVSHWKMLPIRDVMQSLRGPLVREESGTWTSTPVVEYFHMLPYTGILADWFSRIGVKNVDSSPMKVESHETIVYKKRNSSQRSSNFDNNHAGKALSSTEASGLNDNAFSIGSLPHNIDIDEAGNSQSSADDQERMLPDANYMPASNKMIVPVDSPVNYMPVNSPAQSNGAIISALIPEKPLSIDDEGVKNDFSESITADGLLPKQDGVHVNSAVPYDSRSKQVDEVQLTIASKENILSQTALKVLFRKREILSQKLCSIEHELAVCDSNIQKILKGDEDALAVKIDSIVEGCNDYLLQNAASIQDRSSQLFPDQSFPERIKRKGLSEANLCLRNSCQELDDVCYENNWILPRYHLSSTDGGFQAEVTVEGSDFKFASIGKVCGNPRAARVSSASLILAKLQRLATAC